MVQALATVLAAQRRLEDSVGSAVVIPAVDAQVAEIERMVIDACGDVRPSLLNVAAQWSQFAGWLHANVGEHVAGCGISAAPCNGRPRSGTGSSSGR